MTPWVLVPVLPLAMLLLPLPPLLLAPASTKLLLSCGALQAPSPPPLPLQPVAAFGVALWTVCFTRSSSTLLMRAGPASRAAAPRFPGLVVQRGINRIKRLSYFDVVALGCKSRAYHTGMGGLISTASLSVSTIATHSLKTRDPTSQYMVVCVPSTFSGSGPPARCLSTLSCSEGDPSNGTKQ